MKEYTKRMGLRKHALRVLFFLVVPLVCLGGLPQPAVTYYGQAKDGYGWPYTKDATIFLVSGTNRLAEYEINGSLSPGVNFMLTVPLDDGRDTELYSQVAVHTGETVSIVVQDLYGQHTIMESNTVPAIPAQGEVLLINVTAGTDIDHDGLSDAWEQELVNYLMDPAISNIWDIQPGDDPDGDRCSNFHEYISGTFAFLDYDYFYAEMLEPTSNGRVRIEFLSVNGKVYGLEQTTNAMSGVWSGCAYSRTETGELEEGPAEGSGDWFTFYVPLTPTNRILRMTVR